jgi:hypothetical protein
MTEALKEKKELPEPLKDIIKLLAEIAVQQHFDEAKATANTAPKNTRGTKR